MKGKDKFKLMQQARVMLEKGDKMADIAVCLGVSRVTVSKWAKQMGLSRNRLHLFPREIDIMHSVLDEIATYWALVVEFRPLEEMTPIAEYIADILHNYPNRITCKKCYQPIAGLALHRVNLLRILADAASKTTDHHKVFECFVFMEETAVSALSVLSKC